MVELAAGAALLMALFRPLPVPAHAVTVDVVPATELQTRRAQEDFDATAAAAARSGALGELGGAARVLGAATLRGGTAVLGIRARTTDASGDAVDVYALVALRGGGGTGPSSETLVACDATGAGVAFTIADVGADAVVALVGTGGHVDLGEGRVVALDGGAMQVWTDPTLQAGARPSALHIGQSSPSTFC